MVQHPDIAGQGICQSDFHDPVRCYDAPRQFWRNSGAEMIEEAVNQTLNQGILTRDLGWTGFDCRDDCSHYWESLR